jgi:hypothetical protein
VELLSVADVNPALINAAETKSDAYDAEVEKNIATPKRQKRKVTAANNELNLEEGNSATGLKKGKIVSSTDNQEENSDKQYGNSDSHAEKVPNATLTKGNSQEQGFMYSSRSLCG